MKNKISQERKKYLKKVKIKKLLVVATQLTILIGFLVIWEALANAKIIDSFITSQPSRIWSTFTHLTSNDLLKHVKVTVYETIVGFGLGTLMGVAIAIILWWSKFLAKVSEPFLVVLNSLPKVALGPIIIIWVRIRNPCNHNDGNFNFLNSYCARTFSSTKLQLLTKIVIPANIGTFINSLKVNIGLSLVGVISGEFLVSKAGLGYLIVYGGQVFKLDLVMTSVIILGIVAGIMYGGVLLLERFIRK